MNSLRSRNVRMLRPGLPATVPTLDTVIRDFFQSRQIKPSTEQEYRWLYQRCFEGWKDRPINSITKDEVEVRHREISIERGVSSASNGMRFFRAVMNYAMYKYEIDGEPVLKINPVKRISEIRAWKPWKPRRTYVKPADLPAWFSCVLKLRDTTLRDLLLFLLMTGMRKTEAANLAWRDVDLTEATVTVRDTKNGDDHTVPISDFLVLLLQRRRDCADESDTYVFSARLRKNAAYDAHVQYRRVVEKTGIVFTWHDLRRTFCTTAENAGVSYEIIARLVNHRSPGGITGGYIVRSVERLRLPMQQITDEMLRLGAVQKPSQTQRLSTPGLTLLDCLKMAYQNGAATVVNGVAFFSDDALEVANKRPAQEVGSLLAKQGLLYRDSVLDLRSACGTDRRYGIVEALLREG